MGEILAVVVPLYALIVAGLIAGRTRVFRDASAPLNAYVYYFAIPAFLFMAIVEAPRDVALSPAFFLITILLTLAVATAVYLVVAMTRWREHRRAMWLVTGFGNIGYFGLPITLGILGQRAALPIAFAVIIHNLIFLIGYPALHAFSGRGNLRQAIWRAGPKNPMFGAVIVAFILFLFEIPLPGMITFGLGLLADSTIPVALVAIGMALGPALAQLGSGGISWAQVGVAISVKNVALPLLTWAAAALFLDDPMLTAVLVMMAAMPTGVASFTMSQVFDPDPKPVAVIVASSTLVALVSLPLFIFAVT